MSTQFVDQFHLNKPLFSVSSKCTTHKRLRLSWLFIPDTQRQIFDDSKRREEAMILRRSNPHSEGSKSAKILWAVQHPLEILQRTWTRASGICLRSAPGRLVNELDEVRL